MLYQAGLQKYMQNNLDWSDAEDQDIADDCTIAVDNAVKDYENIIPPDPKDMFKFMYADMPWHLKEEVQEMESWLEEKEGK